jgi:hypothetical protein
VSERFETALCEPVVDLAICAKKFFFGVILDGDGLKCVGIEDVEDNNICVAAIGCDREAACLIGEEAAIDFADGYENEVSAVVVGFLRDIRHGVMDDVRNPKWLHCWSKLSGLDSLALLIHVSHFGFCGDRDVVACPLRC